MKISNNSDISLIEQEDLDLGLELDEKQGRQKNLVRLGAWINISNKVSVGCSGSILAYVQRKNALEYLPGDPNATHSGIASVEMFSFKDTM